MRLTPFQALLVCAVILSFGLATGCRVQAAPKTVLLCGFENIPNPEANSLDPTTHFFHPRNMANDYLWSTSNYVVLVPEKKFATQGKYCAKARFTVPGDIQSNTTGAKAKSWEAGMTLSLESQTKLAVSDWSTYKQVSLEVFNPEDREYQAWLRIGDTHAKVTASAHLIRPKGRTVIAMPVTTLGEAWLMPADIKFLTLYLDTAALSVDPVLYVDNVKLQ